MQDLVYILKQKFQSDINWGKIRAKLKLVKALIKSQNLVKAYKYRLKVHNID